MYQCESFQAVCMAAIDCGGENFCMILGEKGWIKTEGPISSAARPSFTFYSSPEIIRRQANYVVGSVAEALGMLRKQT